MKSDYCFIKYGCYCKLIDELDLLFVLCERNLGVDFFRHLSDQI